MKSVKLQDLKGKTYEDLRKFFKQHDGKVEVVVAATDLIPMDVQQLAERIVTTKGKVLKDRTCPTSA